MGIGAADIDHLRPRRMPARADQHDAGCNGFQAVITQRPDQAADLGGQHHGLFGQQQAMRSDRVKRRAARDTTNMIAMLMRDDNGFSRFQRCLHPQPGRTKIDVGAVGAGGFFILTGVDDEAICGPDQAIAGADEINRGPVGTSLHGDPRQPLERDDLDFDTVGQSARQPVRFGADRSEVELETAGGGQTMIVEQPIGRHDRKQQKKDAECAEPAP